MQNPALLGSDEPISGPELMLMVLGLWVRGQRP